VEVFGPYRLLELIGRGGMGEVFRAHDTVRDRVVALKRLVPELADDAGFAARFRRECALLARLHEPHIIPIHDFGTIDGRLYLDMRLVTGEDLGEILAREGPPAPDRAVDVITQLASALDAAHADGLVHRDVKPSNALLTGDPAFVYLVDFGIARPIDGNTALTSTGSTVGTLHYMAPERFDGRPIDGRVDVYALACVLHETLTGTKPFPATAQLAIMGAHLTREPPRPSTLRAGLPTGFDEVVARGMAKDPDRRYATAGALAAAARAALATGWVSSGTAAPPPGWLTGPSAGPGQDWPAGAGGTGTGGTGGVRLGAMGIGPPARKAGAMGRPPGGASAGSPPPTEYGPGPGGASSGPPPGRSTGPSRRTILLATGAVAAVAAIATAVVLAADATRGTVGPVVGTTATATPTSTPITTPPSPQGRVGPITAPAPQALTVSPDGRTALAVGETTTTVVDATTGAVRATVPVGGAFARPIGNTAAFAPDGTRAYVVDQRGVVHVIDTVAGTEVGSVEVGSSGGGIAVSPDGTQAYVTTLSTVAVIDLARLAVSGRIDVGNAPISDALSADGTRLYVSWYELQVTGAGKLLVIDTGAGRVISEVAVGAYAKDVAVASARVLVTARNDLSVVDPAAGTSRFVPGVAPLGIAASADGTRAYAPVDGGVAVIDPATATVLTTLPLPNPTGAIAVAPDGRVLVGTGTGLTILAP
jgi:Protein kinase domain